jgi:hypothetical protein
MSGPGKRVVLDRRRFVAAGVLTAGALGASPAASQDAGGTRQDEAAPGSPPAGAKSFEFDAEGRAVLPPVPRMGGLHGLVLQSDDDRPTVIASGIEFPHLLERLEDPTFTRRELWALEMQLRLTVTFDPSNGRFEQEAGYVRLDVGLLNDDGVVDYRIVTRTRTCPAIWIGYVDLQKEPLRLCFGNFRLPLPAGGYVAGAVVADDLPDML